MRELTLNELAAIAGGHDVAAAPAEHSFQTEFWNAFLHSSGFAAGIFWSPVMPFIMAAVAVSSSVGSALQYIGTGIGGGVSYLAQGAYSAATRTSSASATVVTQA